MQFLPHFSASKKPRLRPPLRHQDAVITSMTHSDDLPPSTSEDSEQVSKIKIKAGPSGKSFENQPQRFAKKLLDRKGSIGSLASQTSMDSVHDTVREKEEQWRQRHLNNFNSKRIRTQTRDVPSRTFLKKCIYNRAAAVLLIVNKCSQKCQKIPQNQRLCV